ncbi:DoxX family protein [Flavobacterium franklandianum]|uniref:DoxX family protein n=1 Tax=Flavobacterium franklandianum TaxID=2594430 RepID=A0A553C679_9FLAO|nr:DoxX family protein [Flavobacterium franklandianum]TRX16015.1 DoxX family protein [Flavobacterium franklandianum]TRX23543.1 DoxX family protein [Flavobacterium franklandianum]
MKIVTIIIRTLIGLLLLALAIGYFMNLMPEPTTNGNFKAFEIGAVSSAYIMPMAKLVTFFCGLSFITDRFVTLSSILILPVILNILFLDYYLTPQALPISIFLFLGNFFLIYKHWNNYKSIFSVR